MNPITFLQPDVRLHHLELQNVGLSGGTLGVVLAFHNPNKLSLQGTGLDAGIDIEGSHFGDVILSDAFSLAARDTTLLTVPLTFRWAGVASAARSALEYGAVNYAIKGKFRRTYADVQRVRDPVLRAGQGAPAPAVVFRSPSSAS